MNSCITWFRKKYFYCANVYVRVVCQHGVNGSFGLAPFKPYTIPRLEFVVMLLSKLIVTVEEAVEYEVDLCCGKGHWCGCRLLEL